MDFKNKEDRVTFELMERIPLEEMSNEISVIRNVEVTPEIEMIAEYSSYRIRGSLIFTGEYEARRPDESNQPYLLDRTAYHNKRTVRPIYYRIPVDISLPADRIDDEGVIMEITSLDYELADPNHLVVTTEVELQGVRNEVVQKNAYWDQPAQYGYAGSDLDEERTYMTEQQQNDFDEEDPYYDDDQNTKEYHFEAFPINDPKQNEENFYAESEEKRENYANYENFHHQQTDQQGIYNEGYGERPEDVPVEDERPEDAYAGEDEQYEQYDDDLQYGAEIPVMSPIEPEVKVTISNKGSQPRPELNGRTESEPSGEGADKTGKATTVSLLSKFLKNREDTMTQIQVCLVQPGESIEQIAKRYAVSQDEILSINKLTYNSNISGKVLKIPVRSVR